MAEFKKLVISPHVDDEVLSCASVLDKNAFVYYCGIDESRVVPDKAHRIPMGEREAELRATAEFLGFGFEINKESKVQYYEINEFIRNIEGVINRVKPEFIFIPHPGYNQDHQTVFDACQVALRPHDKNFFVKKVLVAEAIHDQWTVKQFKPNYFVELDVERKNKAYSLQKSQVRAFRSFETIESLARVRGMLANCKYAEAFEVLRWVD